MNQNENLLSKLKSNVIKTFIFQLSIGIRSMRKGNLKIKIFLKKVNFQCYNFLREKKAERSKIRKKWMIFNFQFVLEN